MLYHLIRLVAFRHIWRRKVRLALVFASVALGVSLFIAIRLINEATLRSFRDSLEGLGTGSGLVVSAGATGFSESRVDEIERVPGVHGAAPMVISQAHLEDGRGLMILGVDLLREKGIRTYQVENAEIDDPLVFLNQPDSILITRTLATDLHLGMGSRLKILGSSGSKELVVRGLLAPRGAARAFGGGVAVMDIDGARAVFGRGDRVDRLDLAVDPSMADGLKRLLGPGFRVVKPGNQGEDSERMLAAFQSFLTAISLVALFAAIFLIENSVAISVAERRAEIGLLRVVGAERGAVLAVFLVETCLLGALAGVVGAFVGRGASVLLSSFVEDSLSNQFYIRLKVTSFYLGPVDLAYAVALATGASLLAALRPAWTAYRTSPLEALRVAAVDSGDSLFERKIRAAGLRVTLRIPGTIFRLAVENLLRQARRSCSNALTLSSALFLIVFIAVMSASFRSTLGSWIGRTLQYDLIISSPGNFQNLDVQPLDEKLASKIERVPGVKRGPERAVYGMRIIQVEFEGATLALKALDPPDTEAGYSYYEVIDGPRNEAIRKLFSPTGPWVLVSRSFVGKFGRKTGDWIRIKTPAGEVEFGIAGVINEYVSPVGTFYMDRSVFKKYWGDSRVDLFAVSALPGVPLEQLRKDVQTHAGRGTPLFILSNVELRSGVLEKIDKSFAFARAIEWGALAIGLVGIFTMLLISTRERKREFGVLRSVGMSRRQLARMIVAEAGVIGASGALLAFALGVPASLLWVSHGLSQVLGWVIQPKVPWVEVGITLAGGVLLAAAGGLYPAVQTARTEIVECLKGSD